VIDRWMLKIVYWLSPRFCYYVFMRVMVEATSERYQVQTNTQIFKLTGLEMINRFARKYGLPAHGRDEFYDSDRYVLGKYEKNALR